MKKTAQLTILVNICAIIGIVSSYPNSVPNSPDVCSKMIPGHGPRPQTTSSPFEIILNKQSVLGGHNLQIVIHGKKGNKFKGFYIQVRDQDGSPIGQFLSPDENEASAHTCFNQKNNAIHHKNNKDKSSITVYWKAPENYFGDVRVMATVLKDFETYWTNVQAPELVSVSNTSENFFIASPPFPEKREEEESKLSQTYRLLNYNPYSPFSPFSSWDSFTSENSSDSAEILLSQPSETSNSVVNQQQRQLFGSANFDFHNGLYSTEPGSTPVKSKGKNIGYPPNHSPYKHHYHQSHSHSTYSKGKHVGPSSINDQLPPLSPQYIAKQPPPQKSFPINSQFHKAGLEKTKLAERKPIDLFTTKPNLNYPPIDNPYPFYSPNHINDIIPNTPLPVVPYSNVNEPIIDRFHNKHHPPPPPPPLSHFPPQHLPPHYSQTVYDKGGHYVIDHYFIYPPPVKPHLYQPPPLLHTPIHHHPPPHKPALDPSYPNSGYFPKDILTKLTSYIPNIYNALTNNHLLNFNIDNTIESIWKPSKGPPIQPHSPVPPHKHFSLGAAATATSPSKHADMPKYGYLVYNPVRGDPYYVIPAQNEDEFVANHLSPVTNLIQK